ncbi:MAG: hypothetical protein LBQ15_06740 [Clostridium sp.]|jgi:hypothetical protein|nr:hypothetical protein [Clostridium sp.]
MNGKDFYQAVGDLDEKLLEDAYEAKGIKAARVSTFAPWLKWAMPAAACLAVAVAIAAPTLSDRQPGGLISGSVSPMAGAGGTDGGIGDSDGSGTETGSAAQPSVAPPSLKLKMEEPESAACYADPADWRGLPAGDYVLNEETGGIAADRIVFTSLQDLAEDADAWILVPAVHEVSAEENHMQTSVAAYAETIGDVIRTRPWDDYKISTGSRILIRQTLIGGCTMDEPNNLLREGGVYLLPVKFSADLGAYRIVGDLDVLFELNDDGKIVSHSRFAELSQYDGKALPELLDDVRALYPTSDLEFIEQPISSAEQAKQQTNTAYICSGFRKFSVEFEKETVIKGAAVYLFQVVFGEKGINGSEYAAIAKKNGAFLRGDLDPSGELKIFGGLGGFPKDSR